jgi:hypothetical protein
VFQKELNVYIILNEYAIAQMIGVLLTSQVNNFKNLDVLYKMYAKQTFSKCILIFTYNE